MTTREKVLDALQQNPDGLSRRELHRIVGCNLGTLRQQLASLTSTGVVTITEEQREYGMTKVHRATGAGAPQVMDGQEQMDVETDAAS